ncbi:MAG: TonB-dependent receptor [Spirochaetaceae bacterium]|jgi:vitamin B12 transporter|nr:TonB-dependent receptor [Spirochaetaceae bacterium]
MKNKTLPFLTSLFFLFVFFNPLFAQQSGAERNSPDGPPTGPSAASPSWGWGSEWEEDEFLNYGEGSGLTVTGTRKTSQQMEVIDKEEIEKRAAADLGVLLEEVIDAGITSYGGYGNQTSINIRGFDSSRIAFLIDGVPANSPKSGEFDVSKIDLSRVERIEIIYGASDAKFNVTGALGGVINIITKKKRAEGLSFGFGFSNLSYMPGVYNKNGGSLGERRYEDLADSQNVYFNVGAGFKKIKAELSLKSTRAANHYLYKDYYGFARRKQSNEVLDFGAGLSLLWAEPNLDVNSTTDVYGAARNYPVTGTAEGAARAEDFSLKETLIFNAPKLFGGNLSTEGSISYTYEKGVYGVISSNSGHYLNAVNRWAVSFSPEITLRFGADLRAVGVDSTEDGKRGGADGGVYVTGEFEWPNGFGAQASVKAAGDSRSQGAVIPKIGLLWRPVENITVKNNYFRGFKFPDFDDLYYRSPDGLYVGNPELLPEDALGADAGLDFTMQGRAFTFEGSVSFYAQYTEDSIHWVKQGARWRPENIGEAFFAGVDLRPSFTLYFESGPFTQIKLGASCQAQYSRLLNGGLVLEDGLHIPYSPAWIGGLHAEVRWETGSFNAGAHIESERFADTLNLMPLSPYCLLTLTLNQNIGKNWTVFAVLRNALNSLYTSFAEYPMPGVNLTAGFRARFGE